MDYLLGPLLSATGQTFIEVVPSTLDPKMALVESRIKDPLEIEQSPASGQ